MPALIYSPTDTGVSPAMTPANAQGANFTPAVGQQLEHLGEEGSRVAADMNHIQYQQKVASEKVQLDSVMADGFQQFTKYSEAQKGQVGQDGAGYTDRIMKAYDDWSAKTLAQPTTPQVKALAAAQVKTLGNHFMERAMNWEAQAGADYRTNTINQATETNAVTAEQQPELYDTLLKNQLDYLHGSMGVLHSPQRMMDLENHIRRTMAESASLGFCRRNPATCAAILSGEHPLPPDSVQAKIVAEANARGVDPAMALANAQLESGMKPGAANPSPGETSAGLFGQTDTSWAQYAGKGADRGDVDTQVKSGVAQIADNQRILKKELGRDPTPYEMRMAHWFGPGIAQPANSAGDNTPFAQVLRKAGYSEKSIPTVLAHNGLSASTTLGDLKHVVKTDMDKAMTATAGFANAPTAEDGADTSKMPAFLAALSPQGREAMLTHSQTLMRKDQTLERAGVESRYQNAAAAWSHFDSAKDPPSLAEWRSAFGPQLGTMKYQEQVEVQNAAAQGAKVATASPAEQQQILANMPTDAIGYRMRDSMQAMIDQVNRARAADMIGFDQTKGGKVTQPIDWGDTQSLSGQIAGRLAQAHQLSAQYGVPMKPFSETEAGQLNKFFNTATPEQMQQYIGAFHSGAGGRADDYQAMLGQVIKDHPAVAMAGGIADQNPSASQMILTGTRMLHPAGEKKEASIIMPKDDGIGGFRQAFQDRGAAEAYGINQQSADAALEAMKAYYIAAQSPKDRNDKTIDPGLWQKAVDAVSGGIVEFGSTGGKVLPPYGMPADKFHDYVAQVWPSVMEKSGLDQASHAMNQYSLRSLGPSQYGVMTGTGPLRGANGQAVVFDLLNPGDQQQSLQTPDQITVAASRKLQADVLTKLRGLPSKL